MQDEEVEPQTGKKADTERNPKKDGGMKMKKIVVVCCLLLSFMLGACYFGAVSAEQNVSSQPWEWHQTGNYYTLYFVDHETGVEYIVATTSLNGNDRSIAISPRYTENGALYVEDSKAVIGWNH